jgi:23S rRNA (adenine2503-C2)-methyltransferase
VKIHPLWQAARVKMPADLKGFDSPEIEDWALERGFPAYRGRQIHSWLFRRLAGSFEDMSDLPKSFRSLLAREATMNHLALVDLLLSGDETRKYVFELTDGHRIESVLIPEREHRTLCISSQVGCAMGCSFCLTGKQGLKRNLSTAEIVDQVIQVRRSLESPERLTNVVLMGMGEPLANYKNVIKAVRILVSATGMNFSHRKITLSTSGLVPEIIRFGRDITINLAVSLNAANDETRSMLMPVNLRYPLEKLLDACRTFPLPNRRMITFEYILIDGINDRKRDALCLVKLLSGLRAKVNLIPLNPHEGSPFSPPPMEKILTFQKQLIDRHLTAIIRKSKGQDILAACGQLSGNRPAAIG